MPGAPEPRPRWDIRRLAETDSTNRVVLDLARAGEPEGVVVVADHQTAGRGRLGRTWEAPPGSSLLVTVLLRPSIPVADGHLVTIAAALAAADACAAVAGIRPGLKWPNDLVVERDGATRKIAGLLAESLVAGPTLDAVALGMGLNVQWPADLPDHLAGIATALNHEAGADVDRDAVLAAWLDCLADRYDRLTAPGGTDALLAAYRVACVTLGRSVRVDLGGETLEGVALEVTREGHLVVDAGGRRTVTAGDVVHLRAA
ncbi:MAG TPA: biotin--[acetyl-CoA-carboxylase] ligase [Acidimicrobiales bacterium]|nr:biotin--[acetyl-CoA-carboxylase] ligase [Acidimicrobiales bacterium]